MMPASSVLVHSYLSISFVFFYRRRRFVLKFEKCLMFFGHHVEFEIRVWKKNDFRSLIKHYFLRGKTENGEKETKEKLDKYYAASAPMISPQRSGVR